MAVCLPYVSVQQIVYHQLLEVEALSQISEYSYTHINTYSKRLLRGLKNIHSLNYNVIFIEYKILHYRNKSISYILYAYMGWEK